MAVFFSSATTARQDEALTIVVADINEERASRQPPLPALTITQYLGARIDDLINRYVKQVSLSDVNVVLVAYEGATPTVQASVRSRLGL